MHIDSTQVLFETIQLRRSRNRDDPILLGEQPCQRNLSRGDIPLMREGGNDINQGLVCLTVFFAEPRNRAAEVALVELCLGAHLPGEESLPKGTEGDEAN